MEQYLEEKRVEFEQILFSKDWGQVQEFYKEMESEGYGQYVPEISDLMTEEDVRDYKNWDEKTNGSTEVQADDK